ncbi:hypothetical protein CMO91_02275 [Candidatus Woesearchaeota archaeon]|nr:hypothetical protein [Candidatus Woesearchaeota archaeon]|tara:strand:+ start:149 stop:364 length:216 start_codon:yes stop_codon:yes gene_type:complete
MKQLPGQPATYRLFMGSACFGVHVLEDTRQEGDESYRIRVTEIIRPDSELTVGNEIDLTQTSEPSWRLRLE